MCCHKLSKCYIIVSVLTGEEARSIIIRIAVSKRTVALEVLSRRAALTHVWIVESTTTAVLIRVVDHTGALACYHVRTIHDFEIIRTSRVKIHSTTSRCAGVPLVTCSSWCHLQRTL